MKKSLRPVIWVTFGVYCLFAVYFLFIDARDFSGSIADHFKYSTNFVPFKTILYFLPKAMSGSANAIKNLVGNLFVFFPLGIFLPCLFKKVNGFLRVLIIGFSIVFAVELLQLILTLGSFDVDDLILNLAGCLLGYFILKKRPKNEKPVLWIAFGIYGIVLLYLLFLYSVNYSVSITEYLKYHSDFQPFETTYFYLSGAFERTLSIGVVVRYILKNMLLFLPLGVFLPCVFKKADNILKILIIGLCIITGIEFIQLFFRIGGFDIDDLIWSLTGCALGYVLLKIARFEVLENRLNF